jgi:hypothetical protein
MSGQPYGGYYPSYPNYSPYPPHYHYNNMPGPSSMVQWQQDPHYPIVSGPLPYQMLTNHGAHQTPFGPPLNPMARYDHSRSVVTNPAPFPAQFPMSHYGTVSDRTSEQMRWQNGSTPTNPPLVDTYRPATPITIPTYDIPEKPYGMAPSATPTLDDNTPNDSIPTLTKRSSMVESTTTTTTTTTTSTNGSMINQPVVKMPCLVQVVPQELKDPVMASSLMPNSVSLPIAVPAIHHFPSSTIVDTEPASTLTGTENVTNTEPLLIHHELTESLTNHPTPPETDVSLFSTIDKNHVGMQYLEYISTYLQQFLDTIEDTDLEKYIDNTELPLVSNNRQETDDDEDDEEEEEEEEESEEDIYGKRNILQGRSEIFLKNKKQTDWSPAAKGFYDFLRRGTIVGTQMPATPGAFWNAIIDLAEKTARQDPRIPKDYIFSSFSVISSYGKKSGQRPHFDVMWPNYQFSLMVSDETPGTTVYECIIKPGINNVNSFIKWLDPPANSQIGNVLTSQFPGHCQKLNDYGTVMDTLNLQPVALPRYKLSRGDLLSIPRGDHLD